MTEIITLFSGSSGNSTLIRSSSTAVLIDAGRNCKAVCASLAELGMSLSDLSAVFVTHEHSDHISALDVMMKKHRLPIHITSLSAPELCKKPAAASCAAVHSGLYFEAEVGDLTVRSFPLPHDSAAHVGYTVTDSDGDKVGVATDIGHITDEALENLVGCRLAVIEANHDVGMLKYGDYPYYLKQRILSPRGHLCNEKSAELCLKVARGGAEKIILAHLSRENNTPEKAFNTVRDTLDGAGFGNVEIKTAAAECITRFDNA